MPCAEGRWFKTRAWLHVFQYFINRSVCMVRDIFINSRKCELFNSCVVQLYVFISNTLWGPFAKYCLVVFYAEHNWTNFLVGDVAELVRASDFQCWRLDALWQGSLVQIQSMTTCFYNILIWTKRTDMSVCLIIWSTKISFVEWMSHKVHNFLKFHVLKNVIVSFI